MFEVFLILMGVRRIFRYVRMTGQDSKNPGIQDPGEGI
jgi:hypothetical protein